MAFSLFSDYEKFSKTTHIVSQLPLYNTLFAFPIDDEPQVLTVRLNLDDEEFQRLDDEEFEKKLLETLMTTLTKSKGYNHNSDNGGE